MEASLDSEEFRRILVGLDSSLFLSFPYFVSLFVLLQVSLPIRLTLPQVPVTVMSIGMGMSMADFMVREARHITKGPLAIIRLGSLSQIHSLMATSPQLDGPSLLRLISYIGTCGTPRRDIPIGSVVVSQQSMCITTNYDAFSVQQEAGARSLSFYHVTKPLPADPALHSHVQCAILF